MDYTDRSDGFRTFTGFDPQPDIHNLYHRVQYSFRPEGKHLISWGPQMEVLPHLRSRGKLPELGLLPGPESGVRGTDFRQHLLCERDGIAAAEGFQRPDVRTRSMFATPPKLSSRPACTGRFHFNWTIVLARRINYDSPDNVAPFMAGRTSVNTTLTVRPSKSLRIDNTYLLFRLHNRLGRAGSMNNHIIRSKWNYQYTKRLSFRFIGRVQLGAGQPGFYISRNHQEFQRRLSDHLPGASQHRDLRRLQQQSGECAAAAREMTWMGTCCTAAG